MMDHSPRIYISGPLTNSGSATPEEIQENINKTLLVADDLLAAGYAPYVPHLTQFWHERSPKSYETWMALDIEWIRACDAVYRLPGVSHGGDLEVRFALTHGIPVFHLRAALDYFLREDRGARPVIQEALSIIQDVVAENWKRYLAEAEQRLAGITFIGEPPHENCHM